MRRRAPLAAAAGALGLAGCPEPTDRRSPPATDSSPTAAATATPGRRAADGVDASFEVFHRHHPTPTPRPPDATFDGRRVTVTGRMNPARCREPILRSASYDPSARSVRLVVGTVAEFGPTATVVCHDVTYGYRCVVTVESERPAVVEVVHALHERDDRTFVLERG